MAREFEKQRPFRALPAAALALTLTIGGGVLPARANDYEALSWTPVKLWERTLWVSSFDLATATGGEAAPTMRLRFLWPGEKLGDHAAARYSVSDIIFDCRAVTMRHTARIYDAAGMLLETTELPEQSQEGISMGDANPPREPLFRIACEAEMPEIIGPSRTFEGVFEEAGG